MLISGLYCKKQETLVCVANVLHSGLFTFTWCSRSRSRSRSDKVLSIRVHRRYYTILGAVLSGLLDDELDEARCLFVLLSSTGLDGCGAGGGEGRGGERGRLVKLLLWLVLRLVGLLWLTAT